MISSADKDNATGAIPEGYSAVPVDPGQENAMLQVCVLFRAKTDDAGGHLVTVREMLTGRALLGCVVDRGGVVHDWIELWVQDVGELSGSPAAVRDSLPNATVDAQWREVAETTRALNPDQVIRTGWEVEHPLPTYIDVKTSTVVNPCHSSSGHPLRLCEDDGLLAKKGLPAYGTSGHRYLHVPELGDKLPFVPVTPDAPQNESTTELADVVEGASELIPLNPTGGLMQARKYSPIRVEPYLDVLGGGTWTGVFHGTSPLDVGEPLRSLSQSSTTQRLAEGHLLLGNNGQLGRVSEIFHLKLRLLADALTAIRDVVERTQRPMLNVSAESFQVSLGQVGTGLPFLWSARLVLVKPGDAVPLPIEGSDLTYYLPGRGAHVSIYRPMSGQAPAEGVAMLRIRQTIPEAKDAIIVEGTLDTHEHLALARSDLIWLRLRAGGGLVNLFATVDAEQALAAGEVRFRSVPQRFDKSVVSELRALEGVPVDRVPFEVVPLLSSACDLYALAVLGVRTLFAHPDLSLSVAMDEVLSLARQAALDYQEKATLPMQIRKIVDRDERWVTSLGPHRLVRDSMTPQEAFSFVPKELWIESLAMLVRMCPGVGPDSTCRDLGHARPGAFHKVFDQAVADVTELLVRSRSLIVVDWAANREIRAVIRRLTETSGGS